MYSFYLYRSSSLVKPRSKACAQIYLESRRNNRANEITGYLHHEDGFFVHYIEGPTKTLETVIETIFKDPRHAKMDVLEKGTIDTRLFNFWDMAFTDEETRAFRRNTNQVDKIGAIEHASEDQLWKFMKIFVLRGEAEN